MVRTRGKTRIKTKRDIKKEPEDEDVRDCTPIKRRKTEEQKGEIASTSDRLSGVDCGGKDTVPAAEMEVKLEESRVIKTEPEDCVSEEDEEGSESDCDPDFEAEVWVLSDDSDDDVGQKTNGEEESGCQQMKWLFRSAPDIRPPSLSFRPARPPGPVLDQTASWTPLSLFQLFFSPSVVRTILENTNKRGVRLKDTGIWKYWDEQTVKDFYTYLSTVVYTGLVKLHQTRDYWKKNWPFEFSFPGKVITARQFQKFQSTLCLCDPEEDEENECNRDSPEYDKLLKIKPFFTEMVNACKAHFQPHKNICINERKFSKNKPLRCGFRLFALADSQTGYTWNLHIYTGKTEATRGQSAGYTAVMNLLPVSVLGSGYTLYTDSLFSSPRLFKELRKKNIGCCGILNKHHPQFPKTAQNDFPSPASRGDIRWLRKDSLLFVKWMDTREVSVCSTVHEAFTGQVMKRPVREAKGMVSKQFSCPDAVADFNRHMIVPDKTGPPLSYGLIPRKRVGHKWHKTLFFYLVDLAVVNSFILYQELSKLKGNHMRRQFTQKKFREELCREMLTFGTGSDPCVPAPPAEPSGAVGCFPVYYVEGNATKSRKLCRWCSKKTPIYCEKCEVPLCLTCNRNCFREWHVLNGKV